MSILKRLTSLALTLLLALTLSVPALAKSLYSDAADTAALELLSLTKVFDGYGDGAFHGETVLTRAQLTKIACQMLGIEVDSKAVPTFADAKNNWAAAYIAAAAKAGIVQGKTTSRFAPDEPVTRNQAAMMFARMVGFDDSTVSGLAWDARVDTAVKTAKLNGFLTLDNSPLTRFEAANAAYATLLAKSLDPKELSASLTANTLAGKLGIVTESGKTADGTDTIRFIRTTNNSKSAAYPVRAGASLPAATAAPVTESAVSSESSVQYGYLVGDVGEGLWGNDKVYTTFSLWNGTKLSDIYTSSAIPTQRPLVVTYERNPDNSISDLQFNYPSNGKLFSGAIAKIEKNDYLYLTDGTALVYTDDTVVIYIDSGASTSEQVCQTSGKLKVAAKDDMGAPIDNVLYMLDAKGKLACLIYDVDNAVPTLVP